MAGAPLAGAFPWSCGPRSAAAPVRRHLVLVGDSVSVELDAPADWILVNDGGWGYFRVGYEQQLFDQLTRHLDALGSLERLTLVEDTWACVLAGFESPRTFVRLAQLLQGEHDATVWSAVLRPLGLLERVTPRDDRRALRAFVRTLVRPAFDCLGWSPAAGEPENVRRVRGVLIGALGVLGDDRQVQERARSLIGDERSLDADVSAAVVRVVAATGGVSDYELFLDRYREATTPQEQNRYLYALAEFGDEALVRRTMDLAVGEVRTQNGPLLLSRLLANRAFGGLAWHLVKQRWDDLLSRYPEYLHSRMLEGVTTLADPALAADVRRFLADHPLAVGGKTVEQLLEQLDVAVAFQERHGAELSSLFRGDAAEG